MAPSTERKIDVSVIVPAYNEEESLPALVDGIEAALAGTGLACEILCVDDGSTDGTLAVLRGLKARHPSLRIVRFPRNRGKSAALSAGFREAAGERLVTIDADMQEDPAEIPELLARLEGGTDLVSGRRRLRRDPWTKVAASGLFNRFARLVARTDLHDINCGFKAYRREVVRDLDLYGELHRVIPVLAANLGFRVGEIEVRHKPRRHGETKFKGVWRGFHGVFDLLTVLFLKNYERRPLHFFGMAGVGMFSVGLAINAFLAIRYFLGIQFIGERLPLLMLGILLMILGFQSFCIGLLGEMVARGAFRAGSAQAYEVE